MQIARGLKKRLAGSRMARAALVVCALLGLGGAGLSLHYRLGPVEVLRCSSRLLLAEVLAWYYSADLENATELARTYRVGPPELARRHPLVSWQRLAEREGVLELVDPGSWTDPSAVPNIFVYETVDTHHLVKLLERYDLRKITDLKDEAREGSPPSEYEAMLKLGEWMGTRWQHGSDPVPRKRSGYEVVDIIEAGQRGSRFWCEIAAKVTVHAATALGWPARLLTASRDGYSWEHAVAELWSNQHRKWFVLDTDFNVIFLADDTPLSAFELCRQGPELHRSGRLKLLSIAPFKEGLQQRRNLIEFLLPFYNYVHVDLRNDWLSRPLRRGSPAGGDRATWWTARAAIGDVLTAKVRVDDPRRFDWELNLVGIHGISLEPEVDGCLLEFALSGQSPYFRSFEVAVDDGPFQATMAARQTSRFSLGTHCIKARIVTTGGWKGPTSEVTFRLSAPPD